MKNLYSKEKAATLHSDLDLRVYTSNLLGESMDLVLHGGGNTSVKSVVDGEEILYVKGSGWDLVSIEAEGFAPVKLDTLVEMAKLEVLSDSDMVSQQKAAMIDKSAPNPSVEAILHAIIPFKYVDHTHADAIVTITNSPEDIRALFPNFLFVPYIMPGFILAQRIYEMAKDLDYTKCEGFILENHGIFTFDESAKGAYDKMIAAVSKAEAFLEAKASVTLSSQPCSDEFDFALLQQEISKAKGFEVTMIINDSALACHYSTQDKLGAFATRGVLTPEHIIRTKRIPLVLEGGDAAEEIAAYMHDYEAYFKKFAQDEIMLNPAPNYAVIKGVGVVSFGADEKASSIINDIVEHTMMAVLRADKLGGYQSISLQDSFEMEYWELEQIKLKKS